MFNTKISRSKVFGAYMGKSAMVSKVGGYIECVNCYKTGLLGGRGGTVVHYKTAFFYIRYYACVQVKLARFSRY